MLTQTTGLAKGEGRQAGRGQEGFSLLLTQAGRLRTPGILTVALGSLPDPPHAHRPDTAHIPAGRLPPPHTQHIRTMPMSGSVCPPPPSPA